MAKKYLDLEHLTAIVVGTKGEEVETDEYGRVKVQFHWDRYGEYDENSSCWIRVSQAWAGPAASIAFGRSWLVLAAGLGLTGESDAFRARAILAFQF